MTRAASVDYLRLFGCLTLATVLALLLLAWFT
jgi:hypothetical protein